MSAYGGFGYGAAYAPTPLPGGKGGPPRRRWNATALIISFLLPWGVFVGVMWALSFPQRYTSVWVGPEHLSTIIIAVCLLVVLSFGFVTLEAWQFRQANASPTWYTFIFVSGIVAWLIALGTGEFNFRTNSSPYNELMNLNVYNNVNPLASLGERMMDAGRINFAMGTRIDISRSMGFRHSEMWCVAPVTFGDAVLATYDFWAVGQDCCSEHMADFHCGEYKNPKALQGLRLVSVTGEEKYKFALAQAEAAHNIRAEHPIFITLMQDTSAEVEAYRTDASAVFFWAIVLHGLFQLVLVACGVAATKRLGW